MNFIRISEGAPFFDFETFQATLIENGQPKHDFAYFGASVFESKAFSFEFFRHLKIL